MTRPAAAFAMCAMIAAALCSGCGPGIASPTLEVKGKPTELNPAGVNYQPIATADLIAEWKRNPSAAVSKYNGRPNGVEFVATVEAIDANASGQTVVTMAAGGDEVIHVAVLIPPAEQTVNKFSIGDSTKVKAISGGLATDTPLFAAYQFSDAK